MTDLSTTDTTKTAIPDTQTRLRTHFEGDATGHPGKWEELWQRVDIPWDKGRSSPGLVDLLEQRTCLPPPRLAPPSGDKKRPETEQKARRERALVPGCGTGYDVFLLASHGYDAYGLEVSSTALRAAREFTKGYAERSEYQVWDEKVGAGKATGFDIIYDFQFLCALPPSLRSKWSARMAQLLSPQGRLICYEFPLSKDPSAGGPPFALRPELYIALLSKPGAEVSYDQDGFVKDIDVEQPARSSNGLVRLGHWKPEEQHPSGKGTDHLSVWSNQ